MIFAKDASGIVIIENQFGKTDHDHLGKILTYGATLDATAVVWIAERFTDQHKKAIEWLNEHTSEDLALYAVEIELWRIDTSKPALRFNVLSQPTEITRQATAIKSAGLITDTKKLQLDFWSKLREQLLERKCFPRPKRRVHNIGLMFLGVVQTFISHVLLTHTKGESEYECI